MERKKKKGAEKTVWRPDSRSKQYHEYPTPQENEVPIHLPIRTREKPKKGSTPRTERNYYETERKRRRKKGGNATISVSTPGNFFLF